MIPRLRSLLQDERAQSTVEYVLMLSIAVAIALLVIRNFLKPWLQKMLETLEKRVGGIFKGDFHSIRIKRR